MTKLKDLEHTRIVPWVIRQILKFIYLLVSYGILYYNRFHVLKNPRESNPSQLIYLPIWWWREFFSPASPDLPPVDFFCIYIYVCMYVYVNAIEMVKLSFLSMVIIMKSTNPTMDRNVHGISQYLSAEYDTKTGFLVFFLSNTYNNSYV